MFLYAAYPYIELNGNRACTGRLPVEVLNTMFIFLSDIDRPLLYNRNTTGSLGWLRVLSVCMDWRDAAFAGPRLFSENICDLPSALEDLLPLTGCAPLVYRMTKGAPRVPVDPTMPLNRWSYYLASFPVSRISAFEIDSTVDVPSHLARLVRTTCREPLAQLIRLRVDDYRGPTPGTEVVQRSVSSQANIWLLMVYFRLLVDSQVVRTPNLYTAYFRNAWCALDAAGLRHYSASYPRTTYPRPSLSRLMQNLASFASQLCTLFLHQCFDASVLPSDSVAQINFPCLQHLRISDRPSMMLDLLSKMAWPATAHLYVKSSVKGLSVTSATEYISGLAPLIGK